MEFYIYSSQELILKGDECVKIEPKQIYKLDIEKYEQIYIYSAVSAGIVFITYDILAKQKHSQIIFHQIKDNVVLCEIIGFENYNKYYEYSFKEGKLKLVDNGDGFGVYYNGESCGCINSKIKDFKNTENCGVIIFKNNYLIAFDDKRIIYSGQYIDYEITLSCIQIYTHSLNLFNVGQLIIYDFKNEKFTYKAVADRGDIKKISNHDFVAVGFLDNIINYRFNKAYNKLSYELRQSISEDVLSKYFSVIDEYIYLNNEEVFITLKNNKVVGVYHFVVMDDVIDAIY